ncbi:hypothetical protein ACRAQ7_06690 [Erythrobacter sp. W53]|uniref:hypothetical protein n=1 Tax=Erythrobacter sp. W53 TaxID=3425947 RepID=UPI003D769ABB
MIIHFLSVLALAAQQTSPANAPVAPTTSAPVLALEQTAALRCAAAIAVTARLQETEASDAPTYPPLGERGREFFVRTIAKLIDDTGLTREQLSDRLASEAELFRDRDRLSATMPACLLMLETAGV